MRLKMKKTISLLLSLMMLLAVLTGCVGSGSTVTDAAPDNTGTTEPVPTDDPKPDATDPAATDPTEPTPTEDDIPEVTTPTETVPDPTEPTVDPVVDPLPTDPTDPLPDDETRPDDTVEHTHSYTQTVVAATCTSQGYTVNTCSCGESYKTDYTQAAGHKYGAYTSNNDAACEKDGTKTAACSVCGSKSTVADAGTAKGHSYSTSTVKATCAAQGYTLHKCSRCGESYKDNYTAAGEHNYVVTEYRKPLIHCEGQITYTCSGCGDSYNEYPWISDEDAAAFIREVEAACAKYINQFRVEQGDTEAVVLPGLTQVAQYRAVQLTTNFEHSITDLREAYAYYQYGEWVDGTLYGGTQQYYTAHAKEAIGRGNPGGITADEIAYNMISYLRDSAGHWSYLGSSDFPYLAVGCAYRGGDWYICTLQTKTNYG